MDEIHLTLSDILRIIGCLLIALGLGYDLIKRFEKWLRKRQEP